MNPTDLRDRVQEIVTAEVAPALGLDGADIEVLDVTDGIARVRLSGACSSCGGGVATVVAMLEQELRQRMPEITIIEPIA
jgi:Fe-S cluster biogenesis protein NfuA